MGNTIHAFDFLEDAPSWCDASFFVLFGDDRFLQLLARGKLLNTISGDDADFNTALVDGDSAQWADVTDELLTVSLFDQQAGRICVVESADGFVKTFRSNLEKLVSEPPPGGRLVLMVNTWPSNTKLFKAINKCGCQIHCGDPQTKRGSRKSRDSRRMAKWIVARAKQVHGLKLTQSQARQMLELVQWNLGQADQETAKLALFANANGKVDEQQIHSVVGGWIAESIWETAAAATAGDTARALHHLGDLLQSGEHPLALYGQLAWSLRRYGRVWEIITRRSRAGRRPDLSVALGQAGFRHWNDEIAQADADLKHLGRERVKKFYRWLLETDLALKGSHSDADRARLALELLLCRMSKQLAPSAKPN